MECYSCILSERQDYTLFKDSYLFQHLIIFQLPHRFSTFYHYGNCAPLALITLLRILTSAQSINYAVFRNIYIGQYSQKLFSCQMLSKFINRTIENVSTERLPYLGSISLSFSHVSQFPGKILLLFNSLSLDAPFVAIAWLWCFSVLYSTKIDFSHYFILFSVTWLAYLGDRLLDSLRIPDVPDKTPRHRFTSEYFPPLFVCWVILAFISAICLFYSLTTTELVWGFSLFFVLSIYFLSCFYLPGFGRGVLPRELLVGLFFSVATHFFIWTQIHAWDYSFIWSFFSFLVLCTLNCLCISRWEYQTDRQAGEVSFFTRHPDLIFQVPYLLAGFFLFQIVICSCVIPMSSLPVFELSMVSSSLILLMLDRSSINYRLKPVLADCALLTPCIFLSFQI
ncbi:hypothetical protein Pan161_60840 [Gimesia algae]|uniref:Prenyltransferase n=1 Tax=Gimesia algae TaxID=2527971 RepID=A0A517VMY5_9PLAN|nr:hypothetical protein Pan161_60840 [Gimesia algae]